MTRDSEAQEISLWGDSIPLNTVKHASHLNTLGSSSLSSTERQPEDFYATDPNALEELLKYETFSHRVWENACGQGHLSNVLSEHGYDVKNTDIIKRADLPNFEILDFMSYEGVNDRDIITNPPYSMVNEFVRHSIDVSIEGTKIAMLLRLTFLEGMTRRKLIFNTDPPRRVYVFSKRVLIGKDGIFPKSSAVAYAWFVWKKGFKGNPEMVWV